MPLPVPNISLPVRFPWKLALLLPGALVFVGACTATEDGLKWMDNPFTSQTSASQPSAPQSTFYMREPYEKLRASLADCSRKTGYTQQVAGALGPYQIPPSEIQWRSCAYESVRTTVLPATKYPELYTSLIEQDRAMTQQVAARRMTREQRRSQLDAGITRIRERERAEILTTRPGTPNPEARDTELVRQSMFAINDVMGSFR